MALLNSKVISFYHKNKFLDIEKVVFQKVLIANAKQLPIPISTNEQKVKISALVDKILSIKRADQHADTAMIEKQIDTIVYNLYHLAPEEIALIEQN